MNNLLYRILLSAILSVLTPTLWAQGHSVARPQNTTTRPQQRQTQPAQRQQRQRQNNRQNNTTTTPVTTTPTPAPTSPQTTRPREIYRGHVPEQNTTTTPQGQPPLPDDFKYNGVKYSSYWWNSNNYLKKDVVIAKQYPPSDIAGDIVIPDSIEYNGYKYRVCGIEGYAFSGCNKVTSITLPDSLVFYKSNVEWNESRPCHWGYVAGGYFKGCTMLKSVVFPQHFKVEGKTTCIIPENTFNGCESLTTVNIPEETDTIEDYAFFGCKSLDIPLPRNLSYLGQGAFSRSGLTSLRVSDNVDVFSSEFGAPFAGCYNLTTVDFSQWDYSKKILFGSCYNIKDVKIS